MKIIVLAGGLSTERDVSLASAAGICKTLLEKGHDAFLLDVFLGLENAPENLEDVFTLPGHGLEIAKNISETEPDLAAVKASRPDQSDCFFGPNVIELCRLADMTSSDFTAEKEKTESCRLHLICSESATQDLTRLDVLLPWIKDSPNRFLWKPVWTHLPESACIKKTVTVPWNLWDFPSRSL